MQSPQTARTSFSVPERVLSTFDDLAESEGKSRSEKLREVVKETVDMGEPERDDYVPESETMREVYLTLVETARKPQHILRWDVFGGQVAQQTSISKDNLGTILYMLERDGYVRELGKHPGDQTKRQTFYVKPLCADPNQWKYSRERRKK